MKKLFVMLFVSILSVTASHAWSSGKANVFSTGRYVPVPADSEDNGDNLKIWILDSDTGSVKICSTNRYNSSVSCTLSAK